LIFAKLAEAESYGAFAVGMDTIFSFGRKREDSLIRPATKLPFILKGILSRKSALN
jgi:hypothetical protein